MPIDDWFAPNDDGQLPFTYLQTEFPSSRRRPGEREEIIDNDSLRKPGEREELDVSVIGSAGHEETGEREVAEMGSTGTGEHRGNGEHALKCGEQSSVITERLDTGEQAHSSSSSSISRKVVKKESINWREN